ncbi:hypothetical protein LT85_4870 [Collimonas arenae]|uniref:Iminophenyl-pyruvate dimer synthase domain-containing protein n=1 Tax=Collimonas arenae TaxID=279058 RepID=A0A0A1FGW5_9BURK|nr:ferritin-like domain-containing protein [Collimonas arenae]AIY44028.1 hypothetical protein LT85_4870 [Collimonas arenae]
MTNMATSLPRLTPAEKALVHKFNTNPDWTHDTLLAKLKTLLQVVIKVELSTIPIYLYSYYSLDRTVGNANPPSVTNYSATALFANQAGGRIMSVAVEEMLHMSLSSNILYSVGGCPQLYLNAPSNYPTNLLDHATDGPDGNPLLIPLAPFSFAQLWQFLEIEYPETSDAIPEDNNWQTLGQVYAYIRCLIVCDKLVDADFNHGARAQQIQPSNYSSGNIDAVFPAANFNASNPPAQAGSAASQAQYANASDSHAGRAQLLTIQDKKSALHAIDTVTEQGEGSNSVQWDDPKKLELSHYYKFLTLQSQLQGYPSASQPLAAQPAPPAAAAMQFSASDLSAVVFNFPSNPKTADYPPCLLTKNPNSPANPQDISNFCNGLFQYMLILSETIFLVPSQEQKRYFNQALHLSMIWILDKLVQQMAKLSIDGGQFAGKNFAPTFENYNLGTRDQAYANLVALGNKMAISSPSFAWLPQDYITNSKGVSLPDVSSYWSSATPSTPLKNNPYANVPKFPANPPVGAFDPHTCMGLNSCKGQDRFGPAGHLDQQGQMVQNACAGQGYCSSTADHSCRVLNNCKYQGGCGLYGDAEEQNNPGGNACQSLGSCATPINAERFSTDGPNQGLGVWLRARQVFLEKRWPAIARAHGLDPTKLPGPPHPELFANGPTFAWFTESGVGVTACGSSGMSGAGSCAA